MTAPRRPKNYDKSPEYYDARQAMSQHMWRHHDKGWCDGTLAERVRQHDDLHFLLASKGKVVSHQHAALGDEETLIEVAHRYLREGSDG